MTKVCLLGYLDGGFAGANVTLDLVRGPPLLIPNNAFSTEWHNGWTVGIGADYAVTPSLTFGVAYNYDDFGSMIQSAPRIDIVNSGVIVSNRVSATANLVTAKLNYFFGSR